MARFWGSPSSLFVVWHLEWGSPPFSGLHPWRADSVGTHPRSVEHSDQQQAVAMATGGGMDVKWVPPPQLALGDVMAVPGPDRPPAAGSGL